MVKLYPMDKFAIVQIEFTINSVLMTVATIAISLRLVARRKRHVPLWWDDYAIMLCLILMYLLFGIQIADAFFGMRVHITEIPRENLKILLQMLLAYQLLYGTVQMLAKLSYLFFYLRIFVNQGFIDSTKIIIGVVIVWWMANVLQVFLICTPFEYNYNIMILGKCGNRPVAFVAIGATNLLTDIAILLLPMPTVWKLHMPTSTKFGVCGIFAIGFLICIISIIRMQSLSTLDFDDISYDMLNPVFWTVTEPSIAIINACLPMIRHLIQSLLNNTGLFRSRKGISGRTDADTFARMQDSEGYEDPRSADGKEGIMLTTIVAQESQLQYVEDPGATRSRDDYTEIVVPHALR